MVDINNELIKKILNSLTETQKYAILLLGFNNYQPVRGKTWYQKELFLISNNVEKLKEDASFEPDFMGPYSENANEALERLSVYGIVNIKITPIRLTDFGKTVFELINKRTDEKQKEVISDFKELLNDLEYVELLGFIYISYPEFIDESIVKDEVFPRRKEIALKLYFKNKISLSKASELAGMPIEDFIKIAKSKGAVVYSE